MELLLKNEDVVNKTNETTNSKNETPIENKNSTEPDKSSFSKERLFKIGKWVLIFTLLGVFIWLIYYVSTDHFVSVNNVTSIKYKKTDTNKDGIVFENKRENKTENFTCEISSLEFSYYVINGDHCDYWLKATSKESGTIRLPVHVDMTATHSIVVEGKTIDATTYNMDFAGYKLWLATMSTNIYQQLPEDKIYHEITNKNDYALYNGIIKSRNNAIVPSSFNWASLIFNLLPIILMAGLFIWYFSKMSKLQGGDGESIWTVGKSQAKLAKSKVSFNDVAGLKEEKEELIEIVDYLKNPNKYASMGARAPKGVILYGPPGTGKTLLAKATAGEAKVPFYQISGSNFEDMLVGVGAKRVRDLFNNAKKTAPSIIFIDEFDSVAAKRGKMEIAGASAGVADQTINQLLAEMDGFDTKAGIVVMAATNRLDVLDDAILRPGRFDRHVQVNLPDIKEREAILKIHARNKNISSQVVLNDIARRTPGFSGAQLENVLNEATLLTVRYGKMAVGMAEIDEAIDRVIAGPAKHTRVITDEEKKQIAYHEAGHALVGLNIPGSDVVEKITIIPRGQAAGYTLSTPEKQEISIQKKSDLLAIVASTLGGRAAEEVVYGTDAISTGASNDLYKVTNIVRSMVTQLGMTDIGMTQFIPSEGTVNPYSKSFSESTAQKIDAKIEEIIQHEYKRAKDIISKNKNELDLIVKSLLVLETIVKSQIDYIHKNKKLPEEVIEKEAQLKEIAKQKLEQEKKETSKSDEAKTSTTSLRPAKAPILDDKEKEEESSNNK